ANIIAEGTVTNGSAALKARYIRGNGLAARADANGAKTYYLHNGHGDVVGLTDGSGNVVNRYTYDIWGNPLTVTEQVPQPFRYSGEFWDNSAHLQYLRARWYDPSVGRFMSQDTYEGDITNPLSLNLYTYVHNNPLTNVDPTGHYCVSADGKNAHEGDCNTAGSINLGHDDKWIGHAVVENGELKRLVGVSGSENYYKNNHVKMTLNVDNLREKGTVFNGDTSCSDCARLLPVSEDPIAQTILTVTPAGATTRAAKAVEETGEFALKLDLQLFSQGRNIKMLDDKFLKKNGFDAHQIKEEFVGGKISRYDLYVDKVTGEILIYLKGGKGVPIETGMHIK
ncbi:RHS repeat-associated core domain-containing protein, partial [Paenibacillus ehimensis]|uniref:RHS repeat-associated core domain-containing protein n=1 Tax=Paenibacillus ehimensis TaxID=79264 RepID=UPI003D27D3C7